MSANIAVEKIVEREKERLNEWVDQLAITFQALQKLGTLGGHSISAKIAPFFALNKAAIEAGGRIAVVPNEGVELHTLSDRRHDRTTYTSKAPYVGGIAIVSTLESYDRWHDQPWIAAPPEWDASKLGIYSGYTEEKDWWRNRYRYHDGEGPEFSMDVLQQARISLFEEPVT